MTSSAEVSKSNNDQMIEVIANFIDFFRNQIEDAKADAKNGSDPYFATSRWIRLMYETADQPRYGIDISTKDLSGYNSIYNQINRIIASGQLVPDSAIRQVIMETDLSPEYWRHVVNHFETFTSFPDTLATNKFCLRMWLIKLISRLSGSETVYQRQDEVVRLIEAFEPLKKIEYIPGGLTHVYDQMDQALKSLTEREYSYTKEIHTCIHGISRQFDPY